MHKSPLAVRLIIIAFSISILAACAPPEPAVPNPTEPAATRTATLPPSPTPSLTPTLTPTITFTPSPTTPPSPTPTFTPTPMPLPPGGAYIRYTGYNTKEKAYYCGVMRTDGTILDQISSGDNADHVSPPYYCPDEPKWVFKTPWSPDGQHYIYEYLKSAPDWNWTYDFFVGRSDSSYIQHFLQSVWNSQENRRLADVRWLDNHQLYYADYQGNDILGYVLSGIHILDIDTWERRMIKGSYPSPHGYAQELFPSPDSSYFLVHSGTSMDEADFYLIRSDTGEALNLTAELKSQQDLKFNISPSHIYYAGFSNWAPDGSKFALAAEKGDQVVWAVFNQDGSFNTLLEGSDTPLGWLATWAPDSERLLVMCNPVSRGHTGDYDVCMFDTSGELLNTFPNQSGWKILENPQWSSDGSWLYYVTNSGLVIKGNLMWYPAKLHQLDIRSGESRLLVDDLYNFDGISSSFFREQSFFNGPDYSPDGAWLILNNMGPFDGEEFPSTTSLLCDPQNNCRNQVGDLLLYAADWWLPPSSWNPGELLQELSIEAGTPVFEDNLSSLEQANWKFSGNISLSSSEYGTGIKLSPEDEEKSTFWLAEPIPANSGIKLDMKFDKNSAFSCGLTDRYQRKILIQAVEDYRGDKFGNVLFQTREGDLDRSVGGSEDRWAQDNWATVFLRLAGKNQLQGLFVDKATGRIFSGFNINLDGDWSEHKWYFQCDVESGNVQLDEFSILDYPAPAGK